MQIKFKKKKRKAQIVLPEVLSLIPSTHIRQLIAVAPALWEHLWPLQTPAHKYTYKYITR